MWNDNKVLHSNRIKYCTQELILFREDLLNKMRRNVIIPPDMDQDVDIRRHVSLVFIKTVVFLSHDPILVGSNHSGSSAFMSFAFTCSTGILGFGSRIANLSSAPRGMIETHPAMALLCLIHSSVAGTG